MISLDWLAVVKLIAQAIAALRTRRQLGSRPSTFLLAHFKKHRLVASFRAVLIVYHCIKVMNASKAATAYQVCQQVYKLNRHA